jgi:hypothetical protein
VVELDGVVSFDVTGEGIERVGGVGFLMNGVLGFSG